MYGHGPYVNPATGCTTPAVPRTPFLPGLFKAFAWEFIHPENLLYKSYKALFINYRPISVRITTTFLVQGSYRLTLTITPYQICVNSTTFTGILAANPDPVVSLYRNTVKPALTQRLVKPSELFLNTPVYTQHVLFEKVPGHTRLCAEGFNYKFTYVTNKLNED